MRVLFALLLSLSIGVSVFAQETKEEPLPKSELKVNGLVLILGGLDITYEYLLTEETSVGMSAFVNLTDDLYHNYGVQPFFRLFFGKKRAAGFFVEANGAVYSEESYGYSGDNNDNLLGTGLGLAVGGKFLTKSDWIAEIMLGLGRNFTNTDMLDEVYPRLGISLGKRF